MKQILSIFFLILVMILGFIATMVLYSLLLVFDAVSLISKKIKTRQEEQAVAEKKAFHID